ncbi:hypothetical protein [Nonomuraea lactucae]|uniref:hypothetical protein n=1 Tax=Nonomuraea lactucae TaxID=2249762 RepID=UPI000DE269AD|nr:hypothetical protein [Nonomuraea lactucae]
MLSPSLPVKAVLIEHVGRVDVKPGTFVPIDDIVVTFTHGYSSEEFVLLASRIVGLVVEPEAEQPAEQQKAA